MNNMHIFKTSCYINFFWIGRIFITWIKSQKNTKERQGKQKQETNLKGNAA